MSGMIHGIDVNHHRAPTTFDWDAITTTSQFCYIRCTFGITPDRRFEGYDETADEYASEIAGRGLYSGGYHFFRKRQAIGAQFDAFAETLERADLDSPRSLVPAMDLEDESRNNPLNPQDNEAAAELAEMIAKHLGNGRCVIYTANYYYAKLGGPAWIFHPSHPLWFADYQYPYTFPGNHEPLIHQYRVGPYAPGAPHVQSEANAPAAVDHNWCRGALPLIGEAGPTNADVETSIRITAAEALDELGKDGWT